LSDDTADFTLPESMRVAYKAFWAAGEDRNCCIASTLRFRTRLASRVCCCISARLTTCVCARRLDGIANTATRKQAVLMRIRRRSPEIIGSFLLVQFCGQSGTPCKRLYWRWRRKMCTGRVHVQTE